MATREAFFKYLVFAHYFRSWDFAYKFRIGEDRHVMTYTIAGGETFNLVLSHVDRSNPTTWKQDNVIKDMRGYFDGWDPWFVATYPAIFLNSDIDYCTVSPKSSA